MRMNVSERGAFHKLCATRSDSMGHWRSLSPFTATISMKVKTFGQATLFRDRHGAKSRPPFAAKRLARVR